MRPSCNGVVMLALDTAALQSALFNLPSIERQLSNSNLLNADDGAFLEQLDESDLA